MRVPPIRVLIMGSALLTAGLGAVAAPGALPDPACAYRVLHSFGTPGPGSQPRATLLQGSDGALYGTAQHGGANDFGTVFKVNPDGTNYQVLVAFDHDTKGASPWAGLIQLSDGALYGTTPLGGAHGMGTAFKVNIDGTGFVVLKHFSGADSGSFPYATLLQGADGALYGTASEGGANGTGTIFKMNTDGSDFIVLMSFADAATGAYPYAELIQAPDGTLYGTTGASGAGGGTLYKVKTDGSGFQVLKSFGGAPDGAYPYGALLRGSNGMLYGTTTEGGTFGDGTLFRVNADGSGFSILKSFQLAPSGKFPATAVIEGPGGILYGTTSLGGGTNSYGTVFKINLDGSGFAVLSSLRYPSFGLADRTGGVVLATDGALYGTTPDFGSYTGSMYRVNTNGTGFAYLFHDFSPLTDMTEGGQPFAGVIQGTDGALYGVTVRGGPSGLGTVFKTRADGTGYTVLKNLDSQSGTLPNAELIQGMDGDLYGTAVRGGASDIGTLFKLHPDGTGFTVLLHFSDFIHGSYPNGVIQGADGKLYGTAQEGGIIGRGTIFRVNTDGTNFVVLKHFDGPSGSGPLAGVIQGTDGLLYGTTSRGASLGQGNVFKIGTNGSGFTVLQERGSFAGLTQGANGTLYGIARPIPGEADAVFRMDSNGGAFTKLHVFNVAASGLIPRAGLVIAADGKLYGSTLDGGSDEDGTMFRLNTDGSGFATLMSFQTTTTGESPNGRLFQGADGLLYGVTGLGGEAGAGVVYRYDPFENQSSPVALCQDVTIPSTSACTANASIDGGSYDADAGDRIDVTQEPAGPYPVGDTLVTLSVTDRGCVTSTCTATVTVLAGTPCDDGNACTTSDHCDVPGCVAGTPLDCDDADCCTVDSCNPATGCAHAPTLAPPTIVSQPDLNHGAAGCFALWPPTHGYVDFSVADTGIEAVSACGGITYAFASCASSQAEDQPGGSDGNSVRDCVYEPAALHLRAERDGTCSPKGRSYTMTMTATDACGNTVTSAPFTQCVWHDKGSAPEGLTVRSSSSASSSSGDTRPGTNGTYGEACGEGCSVVCGEEGQSHDSSDDDLPRLTVTPLSNGTVRLDWLPPGDPYPAGASYEVWRRVRGQAYEKLTQLPHTITTYTDAGAADGIDYEWSVNALY